MLHKFCTLNIYHSHQPQFNALTSKHYTHTINFSITHYAEIKIWTVYNIQGGPKKPDCFEINAPHKRLEQGLLPAIRRISNNDFVFQQDEAPAHRSHHTVA